MAASQQKRTVPGRLLREHRKRAALSQEALAQRSGVSARTIREIEAGRSAPQAGTVRAIAEALGLSETDREVLLSGGAESVAVPRLLPAAPEQFAGRARQLSLLDESLTDERAPVYLLSGTGGLGKTWLALHWAHRAAARFPDGQLFVNLRGFDGSQSPVEPAEAVRGFLAALDVPPEKVPAEVDAQVSLYRKLVAGKRLLIVVDDARDAAQVRSLLPHEKKCLMLVTSRNQLTGLVVRDGARPVPLDLLSPDEARALLVRRLGEESVATEAEAVDVLIAGCAGLPLALAIVAARIASSGGVASGSDTPLADVVASLRETRDRLTALSASDPDTELRSVFSWSYEAVSADAAGLFRLLGLHPGPDVSVAAAASLAGWSRARVRRSLAELASANLIAEHTPGRYGFHDLLRSFAAELAEAVDSGDEREAAWRRMFDHYLHSGVIAAKLIHPPRRLIAVDLPAPGTVPEAATDKNGALAWFTAEHSVILDLISCAEGDQRDTYTWRLAWMLCDYLNRRGHWHDLADTQRKALAAARNCDDSRAEYLAHHNLARAYHRLGLLDVAYDQLLNGLNVNVHSGDQGAQANTYRTLCLVTEQLGRIDESLEYAELALRLYRTIGDRLGQARALNSVGWLSALLGDFQAGLPNCQASLKLHRELGNELGQSTTLDSLGYIYRHLGEFEKSIDCYERALDMALRVGDSLDEATVRGSLGDSHLAAGDPAAAREVWQRALDILTDLDHSDADAVRAKLADLA